MKILVTGHAGFIASHLCDKLAEQGHNLIGIDNFSTGEKENINSKVISYEQDVTNKYFINEIFERHKPEYVIHLAAQINLRESIKEPAHDAHVNVSGSLNIIDLCLKHGVKKFIFASTGGAIYDPGSPLPWAEESLANPQSPYGLAKLTVERYLNILGQLRGLSWTALRYSNVYGPRQNTKGEAGVISIFINQALRGETLKFFGDGHQTRDYIYVDDVVRANVLALQDNISGIYNVSTNQQYSLHDIVSRLKTKIKLPINIKYEPAINGEISHTRLGHDKLAQYDWAPLISLDEGLDLTIQYFDSLT